MLKNASSVFLRNLVGMTRRRQGFVDSPTVLESVKDCGNRHTEPLCPFLDVQCLSAKSDNVGLFLWVNGGCQSLFCGPSQFQSHVDSAGANPKVFGPFLNASRFPVVCQQAIVALVAVLLGFGSPSNVAGFVVPVIVGESVQCMSVGWSLPNVSQEVFKGFSPSFANTNSPSAVSGVSIGCWTIATTNHLCPDRVKGMGFASCCEAVGRLILGNHFTVQATTTSRTSRPETSRVDRSFCSARARTQEIGDSVFGVRIGDNGPSAKRFTSQVVEVGSHSVFLHSYLSINNAWREVQF